MPYIIQTNDLTKTIDGKDIISNINIHVEKGKIYGFLGPNGAGKTTLIRMLTNLWKPTSGTITLFGEMLNKTSYEVLQRMGSMIEFPAFYDHMSGRENLKLHSEYMGYHQPGSIDQALTRLDLLQAADKPVKKYSLGMKQRLGIARAILTQPELLILDEPANGLDPAGMKQVRELFQLLCEEYGITIFLSSHILSEIESIADTIGIIHRGNLATEVSMKDIADKNAAYIELQVKDTKKAAYVLAEKSGLSQFKILAGQEIRIYEKKAKTEEITKTLLANEVEVLEIVKKSETLEDYFLKLTEGGA